MQDIAAYIDGFSAIMEYFLRKQHPEFTQEEIGICMAMYRTALSQWYQDWFNKAKSVYLEIINTPEEDDIS